MKEGRREGDREVGVGGERKERGREGRRKGEKVKCLSVTESMS